MEISNDINYNNNTNNINEIGLWMCIRVIVTTPTQSPELLISPSCVYELKLYRLTRSL